MSYLNQNFRNSSIPGGAERALSSAARLKSYVTVSILVGGLSAGLVFGYRTVLRAGGPWGSWLSWLIGSRRE